MPRNLNRKHKRPWGHGRSVYFKLRLTPEERERLHADAREAEYEDTSAYVRWLIDQARSAKCKS